MEKLKYNFTGSEKQIVELIDQHVEDVVPEVDARNEYARGNNPAILKRRNPDPENPDNRVPVSYARRMINLVTGYMYKPGLITYGSEDQAYLEALQEVFDYNEEPIRTEQVGRQASIQGVGYELLFGEGVGEAEVNGVVGPARVMPRFVKVPVASIIPIYNYDIIPELTHFIRYYDVPQDEMMKVEVYDEANIYRFERRRDSAGLVPLETIAHGFSVPPLVVYENNEDLIGDFSCVVPLIDAYDVLMSDSLNEFDRFAWAYLILKGFSMENEDVQKLKDKRTISLFNEKDAIEFLTKDINSDFIRFMSEWIRGEIHRQSGIPNLDDYKFGGQASGETLTKWIYLMELFTDPKESYFRQALKQRVKIITDYMGLSGDPADIDIVMTRNMPDKSLEQAELLNKYAGFVTKKTLLEQFADFVPDAEEELAALKKEEQEQAQADLDKFEQRAEVNKEAFGNTENAEQRPGAPE